MAEPNEPLLDEHLAAENEHDLDRIMATYSASPVIELNGSRIEGTAAVREFHRSFGFGGSEEASFSDVHVAERRRHRTRDAISSSRPSPPCTPESGEASRPPAAQSPSPSARSTSSRAASSRGRTCTSTRVGFGTCSPSPSDRSGHRQGAPVVSVQ